MTTYNVTYTAYERNTPNVISEGTMPVNTSTSYMAEQTVRAMFSGADVEIRYTNEA